MTRKILYDSFCALRKHNYKIILPTFLVVFISQAFYYIVSKTSYTILSHTLFPVLGAVNQYYVLMIVRGSSSSCIHLKRSLRCTVKLWATLIILEVVILIGLLLLVLPGIYFTIVFVFTPLIVIDKEYSIYESFRYSKKLALNAKRPLFLLLFLGALSFFMQVPFHNMIRNESYYSGSFYWKVAVWFFSMAIFNPYLLSAITKAYDYLDILQKEI